MDENREQWDTDMENLNENSNKCKCDDAYSWCGCNEHMTGGHNEV